MVLVVLVVLVMILIVVDVVTTNRDSVYLAELTAKSKGHVSL